MIRKYEASFEILSGARDDDILKIQRRLKDLRK